jgi:hypothetical protein
MDEGLFPTVMTWPPPIPKQSMPCGLDRFLPSSLVL